jgi:hypothetical protein
MYAQFMPLRVTGKLVMCCITTSIGALQGILNTPAMKAADVDEASYQDSNWHVNIIIIIIIIIIMSLSLDCHAYWLQF